MLLRFRFENYLSFKYSANIDLEAASIRELPQNVHQIFGDSNSNGLRILKSAAFYGANASGKSNVIKAFSFIRNFLLFPQLNDIRSRTLEPFKLDPEYERKPSLFEVTIQLGDSKFRYGFMLTSEHIISEWLYVTEKRKEDLLFKRQLNDFQIEKKFRQEAEGSVLMLAKITRSNVLFISHLGQFKSVTSEKILSWFEKSIIIFDSTNQHLLNFTAGLLEQQYYNRRITDIIAKSDLNFSSVEPEIKEKAARPGFDEGFISALYASEFKNYRIKTRHAKYTNEKLSGYTYFDLIENESSGSQKFVMLLGPLLKALYDGSLILVDELDSRLHTNLLLAVLRFFNSPLNNPNGGQLIYTSHNTVILEKDLRRDQMFFVKRDGNAGSKLISLHESDSKVRSDASFDKDYLKGKYGAVPKIDLSRDLFDDF